LTLPALDDIVAARHAIAGVAMRTPLVRLDIDGPAEIHLKLENLQPTGSYKIRGATNSMARRPRAELERGVLTASAGNMAQGVAYGARRLGVHCTVVMPEGAARTKMDAVRRLGAEIISVPFDRWWQTFTDRAYPGVDATFVHPFDDLDMLAGNGTIGLEILEDLPEVDAVIAPWGGGGLACGVANAIKLSDAACSVYAAEVDTGAALGASLAQGGPATVDYTPSFVDAMGSRTVLPSMLERAMQVLDGSLTVSLAEVAASVRLLVQRARVVAEGAGAAATAAALKGGGGTGKVVCVVSGGNIDLDILSTLLSGKVP
jgi:threonine dehydratase